MGIIEIRAKKVFAGHAASWVAEALVEGGDDNEVYVTVHYYDGEDYTVSQESVYDFLTDEDDEVEPAEDFLEQYDNSEDAENSDYAEVFEALRNVIDMLE